MTSTPLRSIRDAGTPVPTPPTDCTNRPQQHAVYGEFSKDTPSDSRKYIERRIKRFRGVKFADFVRQVLEDEFPQNPSQSVATSRLARAMEIGRTRAREIILYGITTGTVRVWKVIAMRLLIGQDRHVIDAVFDRAEQIAGIKRMREHPSNSKALDQ